MSVPCSCRMGASCAQHTACGNTHCKKRRGLLAGRRAVGAARCPLRAVAARRTHVVAARLPLACSVAPACTRHTAGASPRARGSCPGLPRNSPQLSEATPIPRADMLSRSSAALAAAGEPAAPARNTHAPAAARRRSRTHVVVAASRCTRTRQHTRHLSPQAPGACWRPARRWQEREPSGPAPAPRATAPTATRRPRGATRATRARPSRCTTPSLSWITASTRSAAPAPPRPASAR